MAVGFQNQGNSCSANSALQCVAHTPELSSFFLKSDSVRGEIAIEFRKVVRAIWNNASKSVKPGPKLTNPSVQQDAQEYLDFLLGALDQEFKKQENPPKGKKVRPELPSPVAEFFEGQTKSTVKCPKCSNMVSSTPESFTSLSQPVSLESCIREYTKDDVLDSWHCPKCKRNQKDAVKKLELGKLPRNLILHLARFKCDSSGSVEKIDTTVEFPQILTLWEQEYKLYGLINHMGDSDYGHYTATIKLPNGKWYSFDDEVVEEIFDLPRCSSDAYILFYHKTSV
ncbi:putative ubiquitin carboxyl-terminal hydrolase 11 [Selaginella moellendorffii]|uniref:putative ubiquitin carboxyl-terminal hydrolase 11 n=1 Tax=Selaginella moellendorffii TaxID=88036 RepID=UPI000D1CA5CA|nr:putative ubiquitin carboxyl-terminal hydrolase 11 [Selaginella moellendorffii]|eukprot:XP_024524235.1 putative ubiquitin carboxyl-terminal hydrolase 11 [Selaginella moellendorffii]